MISRTAMDDIEALEESGVKVTARDAVRLNALALRVERGAAAGGYFALPRCCRVKSHVFREPTIAHEMWLAQVEKIVEMTEDSALAIRAYCFSTPAEGLVDPTDRAAVKKAVEDKFAVIGDITSRQMRMAVEYVVTGFDPAYGETASLRDLTEEDLEAIEEADCIEVGIMTDAIALGVGLSLADIKSLPARRVKAIIEEAERVHGVNKDARIKRLELDYDRTLDEIAERGREHGSGEN